jgi:hypothetical protein
MGYTAGLDLLVERGKVLRARIIEFAPHPPYKIIPHSLVLTPLHLAHKPQARRKYPYVLHE